MQALSQLSYNPEREGVYRRAAQLSRGLKGYDFLIRVKVSSSGFWVEMER